MKPENIERLFTAQEVIDIANETSDSLGNLYRLDFIQRIEHEAETDIYVCPSSGEFESLTQGGFDVCCGHPQCPGNPESWSAK